MARTAALFLLVGLTVLVPASASSQGAPDADGAGHVSSMWYGVTVGGAGARLTCDVCQTDRDLGPAVSVAAGAYAGDNLRVGLEANGWTHEEGDVRERLYGLGLIAHFQPSLRRGLYLLGGLGWTGYRAGDLSYDAPRMTVGLGWDVPAFGSWVVGNQVVLDGSAFAGLKNGEQTVVRSVGMSSLRFAVQFRKR